MNILVDCKLNKYYNSATSTCEVYINLELSLFFRTALLIAPNVIQTHPKAV